MLGVPLAWLLARVPFLVGFAWALCTPDGAAPGGGWSCAVLCTRERGSLASSDRWFGITLPFSTAGVVVAQTFVAMAFFLVLTVEAAFRQQDTRFEEAARTLGAVAGYVFWRVTFPAIRPGLVAGAVLAWARAGRVRCDDHVRPQLPGRTQTMPLAIYLANEIDPDEAIVLSLVLIAVSFAVLVMLRDDTSRAATPRP